MNTVAIKVEGGFVGLDDEIEVLIDKYELNFTRRKHYEEGWIESKEWKVYSLGSIWTAAQDFTKEWHTFDVSVGEDELVIRVK